jgi:hypothetical protein
LSPLLLHPLCAHIFLCIVVCETCAIQSLLLNNSVLRGYGESPMGSNWVRFWWCAKSFFSFSATCWAVDSTGANCIA